jgi:hypothetical protein
VGSFLGGPMGDYAYRKGGLGRLPLVPALTTLAGAGFGMLLALGGNLPLAVVGVLGFEIVARSYTGPGYHIIVSSLQPRMRGLSVATLQVATNLIGYGLGPVLVGVVSDHVGGPQPLRLGMFSLMLVGVWAALHFLLAYRAAARTAPVLDGAPAQ